MTEVPENGAGVPSAIDRQRQALRSLCEGEVIELAEAALLLSTLRRPHLQLGGYRSLLARLVDGVAAEEGSAPAEALRAVLAESFGFRGDHEHYEDLQNADFARVLDRRKGMPIALGILYIHVARAAGWQCVGLNFPGHFVVRLEHESARIILDPFHGGIAREVSDMRRLYRELRGPEAELEPQHFVPVSDAEVLLRLQNNIKLRLLQIGEHETALDVLDSMLLVSSGRAELWYETGILSAGLGRAGSAIRALERFMELTATPPAMEEARYRAAALLQKLKRQLN